MGIKLDELKKECQYCCRKIDNSGLEGFICTNGNAIKARDSIWCDPKNANEPCSICEYCKPREEPAKQQKMDITECITWLKILRANMNTFPEISADKKIEALSMAIKALEQELCGDTISRQAVIDLMMQKWGENFSGDSAMQESIDAIREMPPVTLQKSEWEHDHEVLKAYSNGVNEVLDKIRAEIEKAVWEDSIYSRDGADEVRIPRLDPDDVFEIIDKYKAESEPQESEGT